MEIETIERVDIEEKMREAYLSYAMSVITARALPDVRDGLKPVQRRILYAMHDMGMRHDQPTRKSARIVGEVLGKYHPHNDTAVYDAMVRMAQDFSLRYTLVEGQGNFGSVDGDEPAAMRYTEARLSTMGEELLLDLDKDTVDFVDNFDASLKEPKVLPAKLPNVLLNGAGGIAVGMATNIPPHNLGEVADAVAYLVDHHKRADDVTVDRLMQFVKGPDFPTGGIILGREAIRQAYATGRGKIVVRAQVHIEDLGGGHSAIIVTELPYQVNKAGLVARIAALVREGRLEGLGDLRDESDRTGMRVVIELKRGVKPEPVLKRLLKYTQMRCTFGANMLALMDGEPRLFSLKRILLHYIEHRHEVLVRRSRYELERARARAHILEGLLLALDNLDRIIDTIRRSRTAETAHKNLRTKFKLTEIQARAILDMQLRRLAALERKRIEEEYQEVQKRITYLRGLLASKRRILALVKQDVLDLKARYGDARRTRIVDAEPSEELRPEDLLPDEDLLVVLTRGGYVRCLSAGAARGKRGDAQGIPGLSLRGRDVPKTVLVANSRETVLLFTDRGKAFQVRAHQLADSARQARGLSLGTLVRLDSGEGVVAAIRIADFAQDQFLCLGTRTGKVKRLALPTVAALTGSGAQVIGLADDDALGWVVLTRGSDELVYVTEQGKAIRFQEDTVRPQGRSGSGVKGVSLGGGDAVAAVDVVRGGADLMLVTTRGYAKRTPLKEYGAQGRGGSGLLTMDPGKVGATGPVAGARIVLPDEEVVLTTMGGTTLRVQVSDVLVLGRASWGRLVTETGEGAMLQLQDDRVDSLIRLERRTRGEEESSSGDGRRSRSRTPRASRSRASRSAKPRATRAKPPRQGSSSGSDS